MIFNVGAIRESPLQGLFVLTQVGKAIKLFTYLYWYIYPIKFLRRTAKCKSAKVQSATKESCHPARHTKTVEAEVTEVGDIEVAERRTAAIRTAAPRATPQYTASLIF